MCMHRGIFPKHGEAAAPRSRFAPASCAQGRPARGQQKTARHGEGSFRRLRREEGHAFGEPFIIEENDVTISQAGLARFLIGGRRHDGNDFSPFPERRQRKRVDGHACGLRRWHRIPALFLPGRQEGRPVETPVRPSCRDFRAHRGEESPAGGIYGPACGLPLPALTAPLLQRLMTAEKEQEALKKEINGLKKDLWARISAAPAE